MGFEVSQILNILKEILHEIEKENPYKLIGKGGTILSLYYLNHRDSEDLDFDTTFSKEKSKQIQKYILNILDNLKTRGILKGYKLTKGVLASTNRYHMNLVLYTHKDLLTKIDIDFVKPVKNLNKKGEFFYYSLERLFIGKLITFNRRKEFKDIYDISYILSKIKTDSFSGNLRVVELIDNTINNLEMEDIFNLYKKAFRNRDMKFKDFKSAQLGAFR